MIPDALGPTLAFILEAKAAAPRRTLAVGLCGSQGSGKSTLVRHLVEILQRDHGIAAVGLSLDDLYLSRRARLDLAARIHPLLVTRGVPGTHDVALGLATFDRLMSARLDGRTPIPGFSKQRDEPLPAASRDEFAGRPDLILLEGWCVGARPQADADLIQPVNRLESDEDPDGRWRLFVNEQLAGRYQNFFARLDALILLRAPSFEIVPLWRGQQERALNDSASESGREAPGLMNAAALRRFIQHFERLSRHILDDMPSYADLVIQLDEARSVTEVVAGPPTRN